MVSIEIDFFRVKRWNERFAGHNVSTPDARRTLINGNLASRPVVRIFCRIEEVCAIDGSNARNSARCPDGERYMSVFSLGG